MKPTCLDKIRPPHRRPAKDLNGDWPRWKLALRDIMLTHWQGASRMYAAVLWNEIGLVEHRRIGHEDAVGWIATVNESTGGFDWMCTQIDLDAEYIRAQVLADVSTVPVA